MNKVSKRWSVYLCLAGSCKACRAGAAAKSSPLAHSYVNHIVRRCRHDMQERNHSHLGTSTDYHAMAQMSVHCHAAAQGKQKVSRVAKMQNKATARATRAQKRVLVR